MRSAGFDTARGDVIITMDTDLQDDPAEIPLSVVAADMWRAIGLHGNRDDAMAAISKEYNVGETALRRDLEAFMDDMQTRGLLEQHDDLKSER